MSRTNLNKAIRIAKQFGYCDKSLLITPEHAMYIHWLPIAIRFTGLIDADTIVWVLTAVREEFYGYEPIPNRREKSHRAESHHPRLHT